MTKACDSLALIFFNILFIFNLIRYLKSMFTIDKKTNLRRQQKNLIKTKKLNS